jgi:hypothetical protein
MNLTIPGLKTILTTGLVMSISTSIFSPAALALTITENLNNSSSVRQSLLDNLLGDQSGLSNFSISLTGDRRAFGTFSDDPFGLTSGIVMSTGKVSDIPGKNTKDGSSVPGKDLSTDFGSEGTSGDSMSLTIRFDADNTVEKLFFQYVFGSEELVEYAGSRYNDIFKLNLNGANYAKLSDLTSETTINNLAPTTASFHPDLRRNPVGTGPAADSVKLDAYTFPLLFTAPVKQGQRNTLTLNIADLEDGIYDSAVFIKGGTLSSKAPPPIVIDGKDHAGPPKGPGIPTPAMLPGMVGMGLSFWRKRRGEAQV